MAYIALEKEEPEDLGICGTAIYDYVAGTSVSLFVSRKDCQFDFLLVE